MHPINGKTWESVATHFKLRWNPGSQLGKPVLYTCQFCNCTRRAEMVTGPDEDPMLWCWHCWDQARQAGW